MSPIHSHSKNTGTKTLLVALALATMFFPTRAFSAERDGAVLFFSFEELRQGIAKPEIPQSPPNFSWWSQSGQTGQDNPLERSYFWGNGLGIDGYAHPGVRQPFWGY
jgi:hypothetical protein